MSLGFTRNDIALEFFHFRFRNIFYRWSSFAETTKWTTAEVNGHQAKNRQEGQAGEL